jgi:uncharacterized repeat protein (TIGR01451 family)
MWGSKQKMKKNISNYSMMNHKVSYIYILVLFILSCLMCSQAVLAAPTIEIYSGSGTGQQGPRADTTPHTFLLNRNNPSDNVSEAYTPTTTVSYTITNSVYNTATYSGQSGANKPELTMGAAGNATNVTAADILRPLNAIGGGQDQMFAASLQNAPSGCVNGSACSSTNGGISAANNYGVAMFLMTRGLSLASASSNSRIKMGTIQVTFNRPVTNPILQAAGMGATVGSLGFAAEFTLTGSNLSTLPVMSRLAGSKELTVSGNNIVNNASKITATSGSGGASGSVYIKGKGITSLTFDIYVRGDGGGAWANNGADAFFFGISSMDADSDISIVKSQRVGTSGTFVQTQLNNVPVNSIMQYQLTITNNTPSGATLGGTVVNLPFNDTLPVSLKNVSIVGTPATTQGTGGTSPSATSCTPSLTGNDNTGWTVSGLFTGATTATCIITIQGTATAAGTLTNTATIESTSSNTLVSSSVNAVIVNPTAITGRVFVDNSGTTLDASKAYNGIQDAGEVGIANSTIRLIDCNTTTQLASTVTSANGDYAFSIVPSLLPSLFCIVQQNLPEYISVSGTTGYTRSSDTIALTKTSATSYAANNFGDVIVNVVLNEDGQHTAIAGDVTDYPHRLSTQIPVQLTQLVQTQTQRPNASADQPWQALVYRDTNCNGQVDMGEVVFNPTAASTVLLQPSVDICLVQRVHVPTNVIAGAQHIGTLQASYQFALTNPAQTILGQTLKRQDVTLIGSAGLTLTKKVRAVSSCPSTSSDTNPFVITNQAAKQNNLEYEITYKNNSTKKLQNVKVKDSLPIGTNFGSVSCGLTPSGNTCNTSASGASLEWGLTGSLNPSASGTLRFCVSQQ